MSDRAYPELQFVEINAEALLMEMIEDYQAEFGRKLYPADPMRLLILWFANKIIQERVLIDKAAKQNVPRYAEGGYLDSLAELFYTVERTGPKPARTTFGCKLSAVQRDDYLLQSGSRIAFDGDIVFETIEDLIIPRGETYGEVKGQCTLAGDIGNGFLPGQITKMVDIPPFVESIENITTSEGGAETQDDDSFYQAMREALETFSTAGAEGAYIAHAKKASTLISDVRADSPEAGVLDIRVMLENGVMPEAELLRQVEEAVTPARVRPMTDKVNAAAPDPLRYNIDLDYYGDAGSAKSAARLKYDVEQAVETYKAWQSEKMGRDINPDELIALVKLAGAKRVVIREPVYTVLQPKQVAVIGTTAVLFGGVEDE